MEKMHPSFPDWYRAARITPDGEILTKRWAAIHDFGINVSSMTDLVRLYYQIGKSSEAFLTEFRGTFQKKDPAFPAKGNDVEMRVLAGAELVDCWSSYTATLSSCTTLAVVCSSCNGLRNPKDLEILELAIQKLGEQCIARFKASKPGKAADLSTDAQAKLKAHCEQSAVPSLAVPLTSLMQEVVRLRLLLAEQQEQLALQAEENQIVWWLMGQHSRDEEKHFSELPLAEACLTLGKDLASLVSVPPGPFAARAFLTRALLTVTEKPDSIVRLKDAVNAISVERREQWLSASQWDNAVLDLCPIHQAMRLSLSSPKKDSWLPAFEQSAALKRDAALPACKLAYQFYLERILSLTRSMLA